MALQVTFYLIRNMWLAKTSRSRLAVHMHVITAESSKYLTQSTRRDKIVLIQKHKHFIGMYDIPINVSYNRSFVTYSDLRIVRFRVLLIP